MKSHIIHQRRPDTRPPERRHHYTAPPESHRDSQRYTARPDSTDSQRRPQRATQRATAPHQTQTPDTADSVTPCQTHQTPHNTLKRLKTSHRASQSTPPDRDTHSTTQHDTTRQPDQTQCDIMHNETPVFLYSLHKSP